MSRRSKNVFIVAFIFSILGAMPIPLHADQPQWDDLAILKPGQQVRVFLDDGLFYQGAFQALTDEAVTIRYAGRKQTFARQDVLSVDIYLGGRNHRLRNVIIGAAMGAALTVPLILANRNRHNDWWSSTAWIWFVSVPAGAGAGATVPTAGWHELYHAPSP